MHKRIELPAVLTLGMNGSLENTKSQDGISTYEDWLAMDILQKEFEEREKQEKLTLKRLEFDLLTILPSNFLRQYHSQAPITYGRTKLYKDGVAIKMQKEAEPSSCLAMELKMQRELALEKGLKSQLPEPIGLGIDTDTRRHYGAFKVPQGYYTYLTDIKNEEKFINSATCCAHDLGYLLKKGYVFQNLISVFHAKDRPYTLFPGLTATQAVSYGGFPGKIEGVIGKELYENIGESGLRDLGDMQFIDDFKFCDSERRLVNASVSLKIAHFVSLYLMVFTLILGNRSRKLEKINENDSSCDPWRRNAEIYSKILHALLEGMDINLSQEEESYIDCALLKPSIRSDGTQRMMQPRQKFNEQLRIWFTTQECINDKRVPGNEDPKERARLEKDLQKNVYASDKMIYGAYICNEERQYLHGDYQNRAMLWASYPGCLGQYSGINPLVTAVKYILRATQIVVRKETFYHIAHPIQSIEKKNKKTSAITSFTQEKPQNLPVLQIDKNEDKQRVNATAPVVEKEHQGHSALSGHFLLEFFAHPTTTTIAAVALIAGIGLFSSGLGVAVLGLSPTAAQVCLGTGMLASFLGTTGLFFGAKAKLKDIAPPETYYGL